MPLTKIFNRLTRRMMEMNEIMYTNKLRDGICLSPSEGCLYANIDSVTLVMRLRVKQGENFFSYSQKTDFSDDSYEEDLSVLKKCRELFLKNGKRFFSKIEEVKISRDF